MTHQSMLRHGQRPRTGVSYELIKAVRDKGVDPSDVFDGPGGWYPWLSRLGLEVEWKNYGSYALLRLKQPPLAD